MFATKLSRKRHPLWWVIVLSLCLSAGVVSRSRAQEGYLFTVDRNVSQVTVRPDDRSADVEYWLTFTCAPGAPPIDLIDVGLPHAGYDLETSQAWYSPGTGEGERVPLSGIVPSPYLDAGVTIPLGEHAIQPGEQATIYFRVNVPYMVYVDYGRRSYASVRFKPTYFGSEFVQGTTYMEIRFVFPPGVESKQARYHGTPFDEAAVVDDRIVFTYVYPQARGDETHSHGISFPRRYVQSMRRSAGEVIEDTLDSLTRPIGNLIERSPGLFCTGSIAVGFFVFSTVQQVKARQRKMKYLRPTMSIEGVGIKRGLTAVQAAILIETPLDTVLTMILFSTIKKGGVVVLSQDPLRLRAVEPRPQADWQDYETAFMGSINEHGVPVGSKVQQVVVDLVDSSLAAKKRWPTIGASSAGPGSRCRPRRRPRSAPSIWPASWNG
jgi:hypothetical protein